MAGNAGTSQCSFLGVPDVVDVIAGDATCDDTTLADPLLAPLADNGATHPLSKGSPGVDATSCMGCDATVSATSGSRRGRPGAACVGPAG